MDTKMKTKTAVEITVPPHIEPLLKASGVTLEKVIEGYLHDLCQMALGSHGSDERNMARQYFSRCYDHGEDAQISHVFGDLRRIRFGWMDYGRDRADEFAEFERREITELMEELNLYSEGENE